MKKTLLTIALVAFFGFANAQTEQGGWVVGASSNLTFNSTSYSNPANETRNSLGLSTQAGFFIVDNLAIGALLGFSSSSQGDFSSSGVTIGPLVRYYINGGFFVSGGFGLQSGNSKSSFGNNSYSGGNLILQAGYPIWIVDAVAIEPALVYSSGTGDFKGSTNLALEVGFRLYF